MSWKNILKGNIKIHIGLDCPPGNTRPDDVLPVLLTGMDSLDIDTNIEPFFKSFGAWRWEFTVDKDEWEKVLPEIKERMDSLHNDGIIRGGEWGEVDSD